MQNQIQKVRHWLEHVIIAENFCPFAKREFVRKSIRYELVDLEKTEDKLLHLLDELTFLGQHPEVETTLLIYGETLESFDDYLDFVDVAEALLNDQNFEGVYQLATFHPDYCFAGADLEDAANYTNRAPYPLLHIIREASLEKALETYPHPEQIPERNIQHARSLGVDFFKKVLK